MISFELEELLIVFDELLPMTDEEQQAFWFKIKRKDGTELTLFVSKFDCKVSLIISKKEVTFSSIHSKECFSIKVLDQTKKQLEILCGTEDKTKLRIFASLLGNNIVEIEYF